MSYAALPTLRTPRLTLRPLAKDDADAIVSGIGNYDVSKWLGAVPYPYTREDALDYLGKLDARSRPIWAIDAGNGLIGAVAAGERLGYWLARSEWRKGYGFEAAVGVLTHWFKATDASSIEVGHFEGNAQSEAIVRALGFSLRGRGTTFGRSLAQEVGSLEYVLSKESWMARRRIDLRTERLRLTPMAEEDAPFLVDLARPEVTRMLFSLKSGLSVGEARAFIAARLWRGVPGFALKIERDGRPVGYVATGSGDGVELYYALHPDHWGQGVMSEAVQAFLIDLFDRFPMNRIVADRFEDNPASGRVLEKCGFEATGRAVGNSLGRLEPAPVITYALTRDKLRART